MRPAVIAFTLLLACPATGSAQQTAGNAGAEKTGVAEQKRAQQLLAGIREALGGEANLKTVRGLSLSGEYRRRVAGKESSGEIKVELLTPDKFLKIEKSNPRPATTLTLWQAVNGNQVWVDRQVSRPSAGDDRSSDAPDVQGARSTPIANASGGMRDVATGNTTVRKNAPGTATTENSVLGTRIPTPQGPGLDTSPTKIAEEGKASGQKSAATSRPPGIENPEIRAALEKQLRREFICLSLVWLQSAPASFPLDFTYGGVIKTGTGEVEAIDMTGPDDFAARLFVDQKSRRPLMISYREVVRRDAGYVVSAPAGESNQAAAKAEAAQEIAVQLYFSDYRPVNGVLLPFLITRAVNGVPVDEWKIEKYKINPDLKPKRFEKK
ncbi:MAG TPA: hypothetical protein VFD58_26630 [Blastocatellia bacterium]|nr:hypothetical protein [Blastocatellia bacterium]